MHPFARTTVAQKHTTALTNYKHIEQALIRNFALASSTIYVHTYVLMITNRQRRLKQNKGFQRYSNHTAARSLTLIEHETLGEQP